MFIELERIERPSEEYSEFQSSSVIRYLIGASMLKYDFLKDLLKPVKINKMVVFHVDAHAILYRLYRERNLSDIYSVPIEVSVKDMVVNFLNVLGHYRRYFATRLKQPNRIYVYFNHKCPEYQKQYCPEYMESVYDRYDKKHKDFAVLNQIVFESIEFIKCLVPFFEGIYFLDTDGIDELAAMTVTIASYKDRDAYHLIYTKNLLATQLVNGDRSIIYGARSKSRLITLDTVFTNGLLNGKQSALTEKVGPEFVPILLAMSGYSDIDIKRLKECGNIRTCVNKINKLIEGGVVSPNTSAQSFFKLGFDEELYDTLMDRYRALDCRLAASAITRSQLISMSSCIVNLYNQNRLEEINEQLVDINPNGDVIAIENLNMSEP